MHTYCEATYTFRGLFYKIWPNNRFLSLKMQGGPDKLGKFSYLRQIDLKTAFRLPQWSGSHTTYKATCNLTGLLEEKLTPDKRYGPRIEKTSNLR